MKITQMDLYPITIPYKHVEHSAIIDRNGVSDVVIKLTTDAGLVGWGEACMNCDTATTLASVEAARPLLLGRSPWDTEAFARDFLTFGGWQWQAMTGQFALAGIDMAMWDICGKSAGVPLYKLFGGAQNEEIDYFYYLNWDNEESLRAQCRDGIDKEFTTYYFKAGSNYRAELAMLEIVREEIGNECKIRVDPNQAWSFADALRYIQEIHEKCQIECIEAPTKISRPENLLEIARRTGVPVCANEGLWTEADASRIIQNRFADYLCFSPYYVGSLRRFHTLCNMASINDIQILKHTHGEFGIASAASQHMLLTLPNVASGNQQTAYIMKDDILKTKLPIASSPKWGIIDGPGLGVEVDETKVMKYHEAFLRNGDMKPYGNRFDVSSL